MNIKEWYSAKDLLQFGGLPSSTQAINAMARRDNWQSRKRAGIQGKALEYHFDSLPAFMQEKIRKTLCAPIPSYANPAQSAAVLDPATFHELLQRSSLTPTSRLINHPVDPLQIWNGLFQQATEEERDKIINYIARKGLGHLISLITQDLKNDSSLLADNKSTENKGTGNPDNGSNE